MLAEIGVTACTEAAGKTARSNADISMQHSQPVTAWRIAEQLTGSAYF